MNARHYGNAYKVFGTARPKFSQALHPWQILFVWYMNSSTLIGEGIPVTEHSASQLLVHAAGAVRLLANEAKVRMIIALVC